MEEPQETQPPTVEERLEEMQAGIRALGCGLWMLLALGAVILAAVLNLGVSKEDKNWAMVGGFCIVFGAWFARRVVKTLKNLPG